MDTKATDRYVTFKGIDCEGNANLVIDRVLMHINDPDKTNAFWERFKGLLSEAKNVGARKADELCLLCGHVYYISDLFEEYDDEEGLELLHKLEVECC